MRLDALDHHLRAALRTRRPLDGLRLNGRVRKHGISCSAGGSATVSQPPTPTILSAGDCSIILLFAEGVEQRNREQPRRARLDPGNASSSHGGALFSKPRLIRAASGMSDTLMARPMNVIQGFSETG